MPYLGIPVLCLLYVFQDNTVLAVCWQASSRAGKKLTEKLKPAKKEFSQAQGLPHKSHNLDFRGTCNAFTTRAARREFHIFFRDSQERNHQELDNNLFPSLAVIYWLLCSVNEFNGDFAALSDSELCSSHNFSQVSRIAMH